jgi:general secretion pathway protein G
MTNRQNEDGFTLVEVLVTLVIIGLLTTFVVLNVLPAQGKAQVQKVRGDITAFETALELYRLDNFSYPTEQEGLEALVASGVIKKMSLDPWGNPYEYRNPGERSAVDIFSLGADGEPGGEDKNADIGNWQ